MIIKLKLLSAVQDTTVPRKMVEPAIST